MSFKILGIEALDNCSSIHYKNLELNYPYSFFKNYIIKDDCIEQKEKELCLYTDGKKPSISISAIVGKNGSGKSTIIELVIKAINNYFYSYADDNEDKNYHPVSLIEKLHVNLYYQYQIDEINEIFKLNINEDQCRLHKYSKDNNAFRELPKAEIKLDNFFYTEVLNYSLYAFNEKVEGEEWVSPLFHKNDGYQTPVVLNPFRREGIIDVNKENDLVFQRLLSNLFRYDSNDQHNFNLTDNLSASKLVLTLKADKEKIYYDIYDDEKHLKVESLLLSDLQNINKNEILQEFYKAFTGEEFRTKINSDKMVRKIAHYIVAKLASISLKYNDYKKFFDEEKKNFKDLKGFIEKLKIDKSHITLKLRQVLNYLKYNHIGFDKTKEEDELEVSDLAKRINELSKDDILPFLPPPIFEANLMLQPKVDLKLKSENENTGDPIYFNTLSSGEKQLIYFVNSIYYHLINLDSVHNNKVSERTPYKNVSIILEEIELYFHPDYQRKLIDSLLFGLKKIDFNGIKDFHFLFVTHSPFILSDIPSNCILKLNGNGTQNKDPIKTFGANIHDILSDNFFFEDGVYIGEFVRKKIEFLIGFINEGNDKSDSQLNEVFNFIKLIDEPILKNKLLEMFAEKFPDYSEIK